MTTQIFLGASQLDFPSVASQNWEKLETTIQKIKSIKTHSKIELNKTMKIKQTNKEQHEGAPFHFLQFCSTIPLLYCNLGYRGPFLNIIPSEYERSLMTIQKKSSQDRTRALRRVQIWTSGGGLKPLQMHTN